VDRRNLLLATDADYLPKQILYLTQTQVFCKSSVLTAARKF